MTSSVTFFKLKSTLRSPHDLICCCLFWPELLVYPHTGGRDTLVLSCPHCGGLPGFGLHFFLEFSFISSFRFSCQNFLLTNSCFSSQIFLVTDRSDFLIEFQLSSRPTSGTRCALRNILTSHLVGCFLVFPMLRGSQCSLCGSGPWKWHGPRPLPGAGLRIGPHFLLPC